MSDAYSCHITRSKLSNIVFTDMVPECARKEQEIIAEWRPVVIEPDEKVRYALILCNIS